jgi:MFS transporter, YNFM family, putative membrane transport protein
MTFNVRPFAVALGGFCSFINLYAPQALLPELAHQFGVGAGDVSAIMTAGTLAIALSAPFAGTAADVLGRKWVITISMAIASLPAALIAFAPDVPTIIVLRFVQGLLLPPIFTVMVAYIGDEWPPHEAAGIAGIYVMGASFGGISGRVVPGIISDLAGWRAGFFVLAVITLLATALMAIFLPREKNFVKSDGFVASARQMIAHFRDPQLVGTYAVGFGILFNFVSTFTYVGFRLAVPPYSLSNTALGLLFTTYLVGSFISPLVGRGMAMLGQRGFMFLVLSFWLAGDLLLLAAPVPIIIVGLCLCGSAGLLAQAVSTGFVTTAPAEGRSSAVGLYVSAFYIGGSLGAFLPGLTWDSLGWPMVVAEVAVMLGVMAAALLASWPSARGEA